MIPRVITDAEYQDHMQQAIDTRLPFIAKRVPFHDGVMAIAGFGPSLVETWREFCCPCVEGELHSGWPLMATSGAYDFIAERGVTPDYYVVLDPRQSTLDLLKRPQPQTTYLMATCAHPDWWEKLKGFHVELWHAIQDQGTADWIKAHHPGGMDVAIGGGSTVGQRAMNVAAWKGYRKFEVFGMDGSFVTSRHAGPHSGPPQQIIHVEVNGKYFKTTPQLWQSAEELKAFCMTADAEVRFHGDGLIQEMCKTLRKELVHE